MLIAEVLRTSVSLVGMRPHCPFSVREGEPKAAERDQSRRAFAQCLLELSWLLLYAVVCGWGCLFPTNQKVGSSNLSGRAILFTHLEMLFQHTTWVHWVQ